MPCAKKGTVGWLDKAKFIRSYATNGCSTPWKVWVETGVQADENLVLAVVNTSPEDFVRFLLRPKGARTERHGIRSLKTNEAAAEEEAIPDTAKLAADTLSDLTGFEVPTWGALGDYLFEVAQPFFRVANYLIFFNATEDFAFDWYSGIVLNPQSNCSRGRFAFAGSDPGVTSHPFQNVRPNVPIFTPAGSHSGIFGIDIIEGTWIIEITVFIIRSASGSAPMNSFFQLMVGTTDKQPCGALAEVILEEGKADAHTKIVRKVNAPDSLSIDYSFHTDNPLESPLAVEFLIEGFVM